MNPDILKPHEHESTEPHNSAPETNYQPEVDQLPQTQEVQPLGTPEKSLHNPEQARGPKFQAPGDDNSSASGITSLPPVVNNPPVQPQINDENNDMPQAGDVDVIEKTWVDKAKQIIKQTKGDPYRQEEEVEKLQQSYLKKRYGKEVKPYK